MNENANKVKEEEEKGWQGTSEERESPNDQMKVEGGKNKEGQLAVS